MYSLILRNIASRRSAFAAARYSSTVSDNDPLVLEREKQRNLQNIQHKTSTPHEPPGWNELLATTSEAALKADKSDFPFEELQRRAIEDTMARHSPDDRVEPREAVYPYDSVQGPLGGAAGVEDKHEHHEKIEKKKVVRKKAVGERR